MNKVYVIKHTPFEGVYMLDEWAAKNHLHLEYLEIYKTYFKFPSLNDLDFLLIMGGPQHPCEFNKYPWLLEEVDYLKRAILAQKNILGFCLGAQLIGLAVGAEIINSPEPEYGIYPIKLTHEGIKDSIFKGFNSEILVFHWHKYMLSNLPQCSYLLAVSDGCPIQAFKISNNVYGFQFHMEITRQDAKKLINNYDGGELLGKYIQQHTAMLKQNYQEINDSFIRIVDNFYKNNVFII